MAKVLMKGNEALAEAAIRAGCRAFYGYPITPQNEVPNYMAGTSQSGVAFTSRPRAKSPPSIWFTALLEQAQG